MMLSILLSTDPWPVQPKWQHNYQLNLTDACLTSMEMDSSITICFQDAAMLETHSLLPPPVRHVQWEMPVTATPLAQASRTSSPLKVFNQLVSRPMATSYGVPTKLMANSGMLVMLMLATESMLVDITAMPLPTSSPTVPNASEVQLSSKISQHHAVLAPSIALASQA